MTIKVLVVDDEPDIISFICPYLEMEGYETIIASNGVQAIEAVDDSVDIVLLDVMMPYSDGFSVCKKIKETYNLPIIFITAKSELDDRLKCFTVGGDDYIQKPFFLEELNARILNVLKRTDENTSVVKTFGEIEIDYSLHEIRIQHNTLSLTNTEFQIVELLSQNPNRIYNKEEIYNHLKEFGLGYSSVVVEHIRRIRNKIAEYLEEDIILTVWGIGYKWKK